MEQKQRCANCKHWEHVGKTDGEHGSILAGGNTAGICALNVDVGLWTNEHSFGIHCGHDGPIYTGPDFGCINFNGVDKI